MTISSTRPQSIDPFDSDKHGHESFNHAAVVRNLIASRHHQPNAFGAKILVPTSLLLANWRTLLADYHDNIVVDFLTYGWPINYTSSTRPVSSSHNHPSALNFDSHVQAYIDTELSYNAIAGPFQYPPFADDFVCSPLQTVPKRGSSTRRVVMDLSFPPGSSVNHGIPPGTYLGDQFKLYLPGIDRLVEFILAKGHNCLVFKKDLRRAYRQLPVDPKDYSLLGFCYQGKFYFDTCCPFGLRSSAMICQHTTKAVVHIFNEQGFSADVYLNDFYGAEYPSLAIQAFSQLGQLFQQLGLDSSPDKDTPPSTSTICLGILVDTEAFTLEVPASHLEDLRAELTISQKSSFFTKKQLQSLLGKLSFVTACVKPGRIFMARLLNSLRECKHAARHRYPISTTMLLDIQWWLEFLPRYHRISLIKPSLWDFEGLNFSTNACLQGGGATCQTECISFAFPDCISMLSLHINALELFTLVVALKHWAPQLQGRKFTVACDNSAAIAVITSNTSRDPFMQRCLQQLWFTAAVFDFEVRALHVPGRHNQFADYLSRWHSDPSARDFPPGPGQRFPTDVSLVTLQSLVSRLTTLAHATSTQQNIAAHIRSYPTFCELRALQPFPISVKSISLYVAYLVAQKRAYGTVLNHISSLKHAHQFAGYQLTWSSDYYFQLLLRGVKRFLGQAFHANLR